MSSEAAPPLARERNIIVAALVVLSAAAWAVLIWQAGALEMTSMGPTMGMTAALFLALWVAMMVAMMFPTAAPMIVLFGRVQAQRRSRGDAYIATSVFVGAYLFVWSASGVVAFLAAIAAERLAGGTGPVDETAARIGGALLVVAGLYQLTPLKRACLTHCRTPALLRHDLVAARRRRRAPHGRSSTGSTASAAAGCSSSSSSRSA